MHMSQALRRRGKGTTFTSDKRAVAVTHSTYNQTLHASVLGRCAREYVCDHQFIRVI